MELGGEPGAVLGDAAEVKAKMLSGYGPTGMVPRPPWCVVCSEHFFPPQDYTLDGSGILRK